MPNETWITVLACGVALVALVAALLAVRALVRLRAEVRRLAAGLGGEGGLDTPSPSGSDYSTNGGGGGSGYSTSGGGGGSGYSTSSGGGGSGYSTNGGGGSSTSGGGGSSTLAEAEVVYAPTPLEHADGRTRQVLPSGRAVVTQEGTVIVLPSEEQVVAATMGRPLVRGAVLSHGLMYALRPESRDRIRGIVRREFRRRRKIRRRAARTAARSAPVSHDAATSWIGGGTTTPTQEDAR
ncbi:hypothetical protein [Mumia sp. DW29H23]|uniref:hypothetical protein n=1 Tax=Mumia sp. DW29H23 TaxID=3421241 RepID=UPI003D6976EE